MIVYDRLLSVHSYLMYVAILCHLVAYYHCNYFIYILMITTDVQAITLHQHDMNPWSWWYNYSSETQCNTCILYGPFSANQLGFHHTQLLVNKHTYNQHFLLMFVSNHSLGIFISNYKHKTYIYSIWWKNTDHQLSLIATSQIDSSLFIQYSNIPL